MNICPYGSEHSVPGPWVAAGELGICILERLNCPRDSRQLCVCTGDQQDRPTKSEIQGAFLGGIENVMRFYDFISDRHQRPQGI